MPRTWYSGAGEKNVMAAKTVYPTDVMNPDTVIQTIIAFRERRKYLLMCWLENHTLANPALDGIFWTIRIQECNNAAIALGLGERY